MDDVRVGQAVRAVRTRVGLSQAEVARKAGVSQTIVSRLERGHVESIGLASARRVCSALEIALPLLPRWRGADLPRLLDARHAALVDAAARTHLAAGWEIVVEYTYNHFGERGSVDLLAWKADRRALAIHEMKSVVADCQDTFASMDRKSRIVPGLVARERGWIADSVAVVLVLPDGSTARDAVARHEALFAAALPHRTVAVRRWLEQPSGPLRGIWFLRDMRQATKPRRRGPCGAEVGRTCGAR